MFTTTSAIAGSNRRSQNTSPIPITDHARERWSERAVTAELDIETAWHRSIPVEAPERDADMARLYSPSDVLFVVRGGVVTTVCPANYGSLEISELGQCTSCGNLDRHRYGEAACRWCGATHRRVEMASGVTVTYSEEQ
mgnify:CR=1 FL=1